MYTNDIDELLGEECLNLFGIGLGWLVQKKCPND